MNEINCPNCVSTHCKKNGQVNKTITVKSVDDNSFSTNNRKSFHILLSFIREKLATWHLSNIFSESNLVIKLSC
jgi:hypothetical protein